MGTRIACRAVQDSDSRRKSHTLSKSGAILDCRVTLRARCQSRNWTFWPTNSAISDTVREFHAQYERRQQSPVFLAQGSLRGKHKDADQNRRQPTTTSRHPRPSADIEDQAHQREPGCEAGHALDYTHHAGDIHRMKRPHGGNNQCAHWVWRAVKRGSIAPGEHPAAVAQICRPRTPLSRWMMTSVSLK
jgi:hypothetical protein